MQQVLSVRGRRPSLKVHRTPFRREAEAYFTDTVFQGRSMYFSASPTARVRACATRAPIGTRNPPPRARPRARNLAASWSFVAREVPRPTATSESRPGAQGREGRKLVVVQAYFPDSEYVKTEKRCGNYSFELGALAASTPSG